MTSICQAFKIKKHVAVKGKKLPFIEHLKIVHGYWAIKHVLDRRAKFPMIPSTTNNSDNIIQKFLTFTIFSYLIKLSQKISSI